VLGIVISGRGVIMAEFLPPGGVVEVEAAGVGKLHNQVGPLVSPGTVS
jgi:hypothetical protein